MEIIGNEFCEIINISLSEGIFPNWKCSTITPVEKVTGTVKPEELRPINNLPSSEKVIEIIAKKQIDEYITNNNILADEQSGFRKNHSCETSLNRVINEWKQDLDKGNIIVCVFLDIKRAFETIDRKRLIEKMGIENNVKKWFSSYLTDRSQRTKINNQISSKLGNNIGVPQGSVLASTLFSLCINDICKIVYNIEGANLNLFADDTKIHVVCKCINEGVNKMNQIKPTITIG